MQLGKYQEAIKSFDSVIKCQYDNEDAYNLKGCIFSILGKQQEAIKNYDLALKYKPHLIEEYEAIIKALRKLGNDLMANAFEEKLKIMQDNL
ncbi:hypothetical protein [Rickettsia amblyommatis]|uniref:hypothetical protein n=1 Tax=Rickettsia amblyommatis TaxID=33989 RepID=UPI000ABFBF37|nr:hypothetical protein [Rickettsia amblyommatis]